MNDYSFGNFLYMLRVKNGLTQADIANRLGVTPAAVSKWETGSSKPRVEVLFQLAQLLGVRAEELMAGQYIHPELLNPEVVKQINERYIYLTQVDSYNTPSVKWRRLLAWIIDWNIIGLSVMVLAALFVPVIGTIFKLDYATAAVITIFLMLLYPVCFILRDLIFGGRSLGKRILGLVVLDRQTGAPAKAPKCGLRNLFLFIVHIDTIVMLVSGTTLGDRAAKTVVVRKSVLGETNATYQIQEINKYTPPKNTSAKRTAFLVVFIAAIAFGLLFSVILLSLSATRNTEEYRIAYQYLVESKSFEEMNADESSIFHNVYSGTSEFKSGSNTAIRTVKIGFLVKGKSFKVICHKQDGVWAVCEECTGFN